MSCIVEDDTEKNTDVDSEVPTLEESARPLRNKGKKLCSAMPEVADNPAASFRSSVLVEKSFMSPLLPLPRALCQI